VNQAGISNRARFRFPGLRAPSLRIAVAVALLGGGAGCVSARVMDREADNLFRGGRYEEAAAHLQKSLQEQGENSRDQLLYLLDIGLSLHAAGKFEESNKVLLQADKIAEIKDYTSLSKEGATLLTSDNIKDYKGEDFEKVLINTYLSMNYALMGDYENALVEARRVNHKLYLMVTEGSRKYKQNAFARYLSATLYEASGDYNDAYIDLKETLKLEPQFPNLGRDLWRVAKLNGMRDEADEWDEQFKLTAEDHKQAMLGAPRSGLGEIIVLYENGISPVKRPNPSFSELPKFYPRFNPVAYAKVDVAPVTATGPQPAAAQPGMTLSVTHYQADTAILHNVEATAIENLDEKWGGLLAKKLAGIVAKEVVADQIGRRTSPLVGALARIAFYVSDQADCRSWSLLPHDLQIARIPVAPGTYAVQVTPVGAGRNLPEKTIQVAAGKKVFVDFRYMP
jgi:hypothetical protein